MEDQAPKPTNIKVDYHLQDVFLYKLDKIYVSKGVRLKLIIEAHTSKVVGCFGVGKSFFNLQRYVFLPILQEYVAWFIRGCVLYCTNKLCQWHIYRHQSQGYFEIFQTLVYLENITQ